MEANHRVYDFSKSLERVESILSSSSTYETLDDIPMESQLTYTNGFYVNCGCIFIDICGSSDMTDEHRRPVLAKIYRSFISECIAIMEDNLCIRKVNIQGDAVWGIFNVVQKEHVNSLINTAALLQSFIDVLNVKLSQHGYTTIKVGIGVDYGRALMIKAGYYSSGINDVVWMGDVVNQACHMASYGNSSYYDETIMISPIIYNNLKNEYQHFFQWNGIHGCYHANLQNSVLQDWISNNR